MPILLRMILRMSHVCKDSIKVWAVINSFSTIQVVWAAGSVLHVILSQIRAASSGTLEVSRILPASLGLIQLQEWLVGNQLPIMVTLLRLIKETMTHLG